MKCPKCNKELEKIDIEVQDAKSKVKSWQCPDDDCMYMKIDQKTANKVIEEIKEKETLNLKQNIIKLSQGRMGIYLNKDIIRCLNLKPGKEVLISVPDNKHILISL